MAQRSLLHRHGSFQNPNFRGQSSQQIHFVGNSHQESSTSFPLVNRPRQLLSMAQTYSQQNAAMHQLDSQQWQQSHTNRSPYGSAHAGRSPNDTAYTQNDFWAQGSMSSGSLTMGEGGTVQQDVPEANAVSYGSNGHIYPESVSYNLANQGSVSYELPRYPRSAETSCGMSMNGSDHETNSSYSPKSYISEHSEVQPFTPQSVPSDICSMNNWNGYGGPSYVMMKSSSPRDTASFEHVADNEMPGMPGMGLGITMPSAVSSQPSQFFHGLPTSYDSSSLYGSDISYEQKSSPSPSSWSSGGQSSSRALMPYTSRIPTTSSTYLNRLPTEHATSPHNNTSGELKRWSGSRTNFAPQEQSQGGVQSNRAQDTPAQRKADDEILLEGKRDGLTYKEIRKKMHVKCAESTLRGRYRSLTKARQDRVRKPVWREDDIKLLTRFVMQDLHRIDTTHNHSLGYDQRLGKVQWKKVADAISVHGGSYHFGNSTCKRKWQELHPPPC